MKRLSTIVFVTLLAGFLTGVIVDRVILHSAENRPKGSLGKQQIEEPAPVEYPRNPFSAGKRRIGFTYSTFAENERLLNRVRTADDLAILNAISDSTLRRKLVAQALWKLSGHDLEKAVALFPLCIGTDISSEPTDCIVEELLLHARDLPPLELADQVKKLHLGNVLGRQFTLSEAALDLIVKVAPEQVHGLLLTMAGRSDDPEKVQLALRYIIKNPTEFPEVTDNLDLWFSNSPGKLAAIQGYFAAMAKSGQEISWTATDHPEESAFMENISQASRID